MAVVFVRIVGAARWVVDTYGSNELIGVLISGGCLW